MFIREENLVVLWASQPRQGQINRACKFSIFPFYLSGKAQPGKFFAIDLDSGKTQSEYFQETWVPEDEVSEVCRLALDDADRYQSDNGRWSWKGRSALIWEDSWRKKGREGKSEKEELDVSE